MRVSTLTTFNKLFIDLKMSRGLRRLIFYSFRLRRQLTYNGVYSAFLGCVYFRAIRQHANLSDVQSNRPL